MRTKMKCTTVVKDKDDHELIGLVSVGGDSNPAHADTQVSMRIPAKGDHGHFVPGEMYFVDFFPAPAAAKDEETKVG